MKPKVMPASQTPVIVGVVTAIEVIIVTFVDQAIGAVQHFVISSIKLLLASCFAPVNAVHRAETALQWLHA
jgi:hypothetical protein